jgi:hypothetical protein
LKFITFLDYDGTVLLKGVSSVLFKLRLRAQSIKYKEELYGWKAQI